MKLFSCIYIYIYRDCVTALCHITRRGSKNKEVKKRVEKSLIEKRRKQKKNKWQNLQNLHKLNFLTKLLVGLLQTLLGPFRHFIFPEGFFFFFHFLFNVFLHFSARSMLVQINLILI